MCALSATVVSGGGEEIRNVPKIRKTLAELQPEGIGTLDEYNRNRAGLLDAYRTLAPILPNIKSIYIYFINALSLLHLIQMCGVIHSQSGGDMLKYTNRKGVYSCRLLLAALSAGILSCR